MLFRGITWNRCQLHAMGIFVVCIPPLNLYTVLHHSPSCYSMNSTWQCHHQLYFKEHNQKLVMSSSLQSTPRTDPNIWYSCKVKALEVVPPGTPPITLYPLLNYIVILLCLLAHTTALFTPCVYRTIILRCIVLYIHLL